MTLDGRPLMECVGREWVSPWRLVSQDAIATFAALTGDEQWIHVDPERARLESPYGTTIAHGFLTLSMVSRLLRDAVGAVEGTRMTINYGLEKVRFPAPLPAGARVRARCTMVRLDAVDGGALQATWHVLVEREGATKPCCAADWLVRYYQPDV